MADRTSGAEEFGRLRLEATRRSAIHPPEGDTPTTGRSIVASALRTLDLEALAIGALRHVLETAMGDAFVRAVELIGTAGGRIVVSGMGKSGLVARKIAATFASTGTPALFIHPAEAGHGDLGMVTPDDVALVLSWSGETSELGDLVTYCRRFGVPVVAMTAGCGSSLVRAADVSLLLPEVEEACPNRLAPTSSTTVQMALGDALAIALIERRGFSAKDFRRFHPKGRLGAQLLTVGDLMSTGDAVPMVRDSALVVDAAVEMTEKRFGVAAVMDRDGRLIGAFTDGDLRRSLMAGGAGAIVQDHMSATPRLAEPSLLASQAVKTMSDLKITQLFVSSEGELIGIVHLHDILRAGVA